MEPIYADALNLAKNLSASPKNLARVAQATTQDAARWAFSQWALRDRAKAKFVLANEMLFDREGLEMSTHEGLAKYHANQFPQGSPVYDLTVGIGADLIALARRGPAIGFEIDPARAELARHNLKAHGVEAEVRADSWEALRSAENYFLDPARRAGGRRTLDPRQFAPNPVDVVSRFHSVRVGVVKLSPMLPDSFLETLGGRLEFVSFGGECREALVLTGSDVEFGRFAVMPEAGAILPALSGFAESVDVPGEFVYEADPAAIRANCLPELCRRHELSQLADSNGYLTGRRVAPSPWLKAFQVIASGKFDVAVVKRELAGLNSSTPILKQKGAGQDLIALRQKLNMKGTRELAVALYPVGKSLRYAVLDAVR